MKLFLKTLSPVHIGTGIALEPFEYIIDNGYFYRLNQNKAFALALENHPEFPEKFQNWLETTSARLENERDNRLQSTIRNSFNFKSFCDRELNDRQLTSRIIKEAYSYKCPVEFGTQGKRQIDELLKASDNTPYIPGSSIKGFLRTALLMQAFSQMNKDKKNSVMKAALNSKKFFDTRSKKRLDEIFQNEAFICGEKKKNKPATYDNIQLDIMKFIRISDAVPVKADIALYPANLYLLDKAPQGQTNAQEVIEKGSIFSFEVNINEGEIRKIAEVSAGNASTWIDFNSKFKALFDFYVNEAEQGMLAERITESVLRVLSDFACSIRTGEKKWLANYKDQVLVTRNGGKSSNAKIDEVKKFYDRLPSSKPMLRIGWGSGFLSTTIFSGITEEPALMGGLKEIFGKFKIGVPRNSKLQNASPNLEKFPKSKRLAAEGLFSPFSPFGWALIARNEEELKEEVTMGNASAGIPEVEEQPFNEEEIFQKNAGNKYKQGSSVVEAKFISASGKQIKVEIMDERYKGKEFVFSYGSPQIIEQKKYMKVKVVQLNKNNEILTVGFAGF